MSSISPVGPTGGPSSINTGSRTSGKQALLASARSVSETTNAEQNVNAVEQESQRLSARAPATDGLGSTIDVSG